MPCCGAAVLAPPDHRARQLFFFYGSGHPRDLHSFPTRRSSDLGASFAAVSDEMTVRARPGLYRDVLGRAGVEVAQVNSLERPFCETEHPDLLQQDLSLIDLSDRKSTRLNSSHLGISYAVFCLKK